MKLFISFNHSDLQQAIAVASQVDTFCDAFELGAVLLINYGVQSIIEFRNKFPQKILIADTNIAEFEKEISDSAINAGCDWITVLGGAGANTIHNTCLQAHKRGCKVMVDLIDIISTGQLALDAKALGADAILYHTTENSYTLLDHWDMIKGNTKLPIYINTHITRENIKEFTGFEAAGLVIGAAITHSENPAEEAAYFYQLIQNAR